MNAFQADGQASKVISPFVRLKGFARAYRKERTLFSKVETRHTVIYLC